MTAASCFAIETVRDFWSRAGQPSAEAYRQTLAALWSGMARVGGPVFFFVGWKGRALCGFGSDTQARSAELARVLGAVIPGSTLQPLDDPGLDARRAWVEGVRGIPALDPGLMPEAADRILLALGGRPFLFAVAAVPAGEDELRAEITKAEAGLMDLGDRRLRPGSIEGENDPFAQFHRTRAAFLLERLRAMESGEGWRVSASLFTEAEADLDRARAVLEPAWNHAAVPVTPARLAVAERPEWTLLTTAELAQLAHLPREPRAGYDVESGARLRVPPPPEGPGSEINLGEILDRGRPAGVLRYPAAWLNRHCLIAGATGTGKTSALLTILCQAWARHRIPFLVIEPSVKREFRRLVEEPWARPLRFFSAGEESYPFRLNVFEPQPGVPLHTHIGILRAQLNASIGMVQPMPYVLEAAIYHVYRERGFDLTTGNNRRGEGTSLYPTLSDLREAIPAVVRRSEWSAEVKGNIIGGLQARISTLLEGPLGKMLDCRRSYPMGDLLSAPAVLELASLGDDFAKRFLMGAVWAHVVEYRTFHPAEPGHLLAIEEAHRLLRRAATGPVRDEAADPGAQAVETFANMMAEMRAFGQGVIVVEQSPFLLHDSVLTHTNLKIAFPMVDQPNTDLVSRQMFLNEEQKETWRFGGVGTAAALGSGMRGSYLIRMPRFDLSPARPEAMEAAARLIREDFAAHVTSHRFPDHGHVCPEACDPTSFHAYKVAAAGAMLAARAGDAPLDIVRYLGPRLLTGEPAPGCCGALQAVDGILRRKGVANSLPLAAEDDLARLWYALVRGLTVDGLNAAALQQLVAEITRQTPRTSRSYEAAVFHALSPDVASDLPVRARELLEAQRHS